MTHCLPAAAVHKGAVIGIIDQDSIHVITVAKVIYGDPEAGRLKIIDGDGHPWGVGGAEQVEILSLS